MTVTTEQLEANKKLARDYIDQVFNQHNPSKAADFVTGDVVWHGNSLGDIAGAENLAGHSALRHCAQLHRQHGVCDRVADGAGHDANHARRVRPASP